MHITIGQPYAASEPGKRSGNEDAIYPHSEVTGTEQRLFLVCDGVGGSEKGEVASQLACDAFQTYFHTFYKSKKTAGDFVQKALRYVETCFDSYLVAHPEAKGMATTFTMLYIGNNGLTLAHIGDSRIYHLRKGKILYQTEDHSLVNLWVKLGKIQPNEAITHPRRNMILRAIQGSSQPVEADVVKIQQVQAGDYFFMCTDGVLESFTNETLAMLFDGTRSVGEIKQKILTTCSLKSRDNYSFYIIPIQNVTESSSNKQNILSFFYSLI